MKTEESNAYLSKSLFIRGLQCHKSLYLQKNQPELKDETSEFQETLFQMGTDVGILARELFPGGTEVPYDGLSKPAQLDLTQSLIKEGKTTLYEATFIYDGVFVKADILHRGIRRLGDIRGQSLDGGQTPSRERCGRPVLRCSRMPA